ncbi:YciI family protein [Caenimonas koreensis]|uniref:YciI family protein n=1 Tax=Caenimonas koreensis DSM 17982 TaxID=1121255 RepID=A0A844B9L3_9BURK|nr:YciI family protein [Caenimonas koreensis]MRD48196.1 YciI family protein [Caenimonas koreensis DSM 17982]
MQYLLMIYSEEAAEMKATPEQITQTMVAYRAYTEALRKAGALVASDRLKPTSTATTVHVANGKTEVLNGPYAETREQLGGYYQIEAKDLDEALSWAARCPGATGGKIEVRPIWSMT